MRTSTGHSQLRTISPQLDHQAFFPKMESMTDSELLQATGSAWSVICWGDGNRRKCVRMVFCRAASKSVAEAIARRISRRRCVDARPWNPETDRSVYGWVRKVTDPECGK